MKKLNDIRLIDQYIQGSLSLTQKRLLEKRLHSDADFMNLYQDMLVFVEGIKESAKTRSESEKWSVVKKYIGNPGSEMKESVEDKRVRLPGSQKFMISRWVRAAAVVLVLVTAAWFLWPQTADPYMAALESSELSVPKYWYGERGVGQEITLSEIASHLENENYSKAITGLEDRLNQGESSSESLIEQQLFLAFSYLKIDKTAAAIPLLEKIRANTSEDNLSDLADWYLALAYGKSEQTAKAKQVLSAISQDTAHQKRDNAIDLLKTF